MTLTRLFLAAALVAVPLVALAPSAEAVASCTLLLNAVLYEPDCQHLLCWGRGYNHQTQTERCQYSEDDIPDPCRRGCE